MSQTKTVWLTGSASGVGLHLTDEFIRRGDRVIACDINFEQLERIANERNWDSENLMLTRLDVSKVSEWKRALQAALERFGHVDVLLNVAGYVKPGFVMETPLAELDKHLNVNLKGMIYGCHTVAEHMIKQGQGHIINIASLAGVAPVPGMGYYSTSKLALRGYSLILSQELKGSGVDVSVVCPDLIKTPMYDLQLDYEKESALVFSGPKPLQVEDIGKLIFNQVLPGRQFEYLIPKHRGWLTKFSDAFPSLAYQIAKPFKRKGEAAIRQARGNIGDKAQ